MKRLFVGIPISEQVKVNLKPFIERLKAIGVDLNLVSFENLHFTVKFLGEVEESKVEKIKGRLGLITQDQVQFRIKLKEVGVFPSWQMINVIWVGIKSKEMITLINETEKALEEIKPGDLRTKVTHLTIARVRSRKNKEPLQEFLQRSKPAEFGEMVVNKMVLYESKLTSQGPIYTKIAEFFLR